MTPLALSSAEKSVAVQTNTHTNRQTVTDISTPCLSVYVRIINLRGDGGVGAVDDGGVVVFSFVIEASKHAAINYINVKITSTNYDLNLYKF